MLNANACYFSAADFHGALVSILLLSVAVVMYHVIDYIQTWWAQRLSTMVAHQRAVRRSLKTMDYAPTNPIGFPLLKRQGL